MRRDLMRRDSMPVSPHSAISPHRSLLLLLSYSLHYVSVWSTPPPFPLLVPPGQQRMRVDSDQPRLEYDNRSASPARTDQEFRARPSEGQLSRAEETACYIRIKRNPAGDEPSRS